MRLNLEGWGKCGDSELQESSHALFSFGFFFFSVRAGLPHFSKTPVSQKTVSS